MACSDPLCATRASAIRTAALIVVSIIFVGMAALLHLQGREIRIELRSDNASLLAEIWELKTQLQESRKVVQNLSQRDCIPD